MRTRARHTPQSHSDGTVLQLWIRCRTDNNTRPDVSRVTAASVTSDSDIVARARSWFRNTDSLELARLAEHKNRPRTAHRTTDRALP